MSDADVTRDCPPAVPAMQVRVEVCAYDAHPGRDVGRGHPTRSPSTVPLPRRQDVSTLWRDRPRKRTWAG